MFDFEKMFGLGIMAFYEISSPMIFSCLYGVFYISLRFWGPMEHGIAQSTSSSRNLWENYSYQVFV